MNIFEILKDIISDKRNRLADDIEDEKDFQPYLVQRWLSMYSPHFSYLVNESTNRLWKVMDTKQDWYKLFLSVIPKQSNKRISYIKKAPKKGKKNDKDYVKIMASHLEISERECKMYLESGFIDQKQIKKHFNM